MGTHSKVVLVTGASSGLGLSTAAFLTERGHRVYGTSRRPDVEAGLGWPMLPLDVCSDTAVEACVAAVQAREGRIDGLVNNAGHAFVGAVEETSLGDAKAQFEANFFGALRMMLAVLPIMARTRGGPYRQCEFACRRRALSVSWHLWRQQARAGGDFGIARL